MVPSTHINGPIVPAEEVDVGAEGNLRAADVLGSAVGVGAGVEAVVAALRAEGEQVTLGDATEKEDINITTNIDWGSEK